MLVPRREGEDFYEWRTAEINRRLAVWPGKKIEEDD
jgi:hypothetical protein